MTIYWIDLFCGAGGTSTGIHLADADCKVIACVNHDEKAIESHKANHLDCLHFVEDVNNPKVIARIAAKVRKIRRNDPKAIINIWASLECTNYSKAKGGLPRDPDSRTLAETIYLYVEAIDPDCIYVENVREFMSWGPLDKNGRPISRYNGRDYVKWSNRIKRYGYNYDYRLLNAADFGAYTSRLRYFGQFVKKPFPLSWPDPTHVKHLPKKTGLFSENRKKWKAVKDVLDLEDEGQSIFTRKKPLVENSLKRIYAGLIKFVAGGEEAFTKVYNSGNDSQRVKSINEPVGSLTTQNSHAVVSTKFLKKYFSGKPEGKVIGVDGPAGTVTTVGGQALVSTNFFYHNHGGAPESKVWDIERPTRTITTTPNQRIVKTVFLNKYYRTGTASSIEEPGPTLTTKDRISKIETQFLANQYTGWGQLSSIDGPAPTITTKPKSRAVSVQMMDQQYGNSKPTDLENPVGSIPTNPKHNLITASRQYHYLLNPQYQSKGSDIETPAPTIIARQDKKPMYLVQCDVSSGFAIAVYQDDTPTMVKIKEFMAIYGIVDIKMRMLNIPELLRIQGFPEGYKLKGTKTQQKKYIGNAVVPIIAQKLVEINYTALEKFKQAAA
ncbi:MAG: DNA cytosine methyltransferase [Bacteroidota bacterium]